MEDIQAWIPVLTGSLGFSLAATLVVCVPGFAVQRLTSIMSSSKIKRTAQEDIKPVKIIGAVVFTVTLVAGLLVGSTFSSMCGTGDVTEVRAPDGKHKIAVYNFDCGATTDFSLDVSMLRGDQKLPRHKTAPLLYSHYHQRPVNAGSERNFQVDWLDSTHALVHVAQFEGPPQTKIQDGGEVSLQPML